MEENYYPRFKNTNFSRNIGLFYDIRALSKNCINEVETQGHTISEIRRGNYGMGGIRDLCKWWIWKNIIIPYFDEIKDHLNIGGLREFRDRLSRSDREEFRVWFYEDRRVHELNQKTTVDSHTHIYVKNEEDKINSQYGFSTYYNHIFPVSTYKLSNIPYSDYLDSISIPYLVSLYVSYTKIKPLKKPPPIRFSTKKCDIR